MAENRNSWVDARAAAWVIFAVGAGLTAVAWNFAYQHLQTELAEIEHNGAEAAFYRILTWGIVVFGSAISTLGFFAMRMLSTARRSEARFRDYARLATDWLWEQGPDLRFTFGSGADPFPALKESFIGKTRREFLELHGDPTERETWDRLDDICARREPFRDIGYSVRGPDGRVSYFKVSGDPIHGPNGDFLGYRGVGRDATAERTRERELERAKAAAEEANLVKGRFLAMFSHELRTPLNAIIGFSEMLAKPDPRPSEAVQEIGADIADASRHLLGMINHILDMSKIEAGRLDLVDEPIDLKRAIKASVALIAPIAGRSGVNVEIEDDPKTAGLRADERAVRQVIGNLLSNAVKFAPRGGKISIRIERPSDGSLIVVVQDDGIGIAPGALAKIFEPFQQADASIGRRYGGTGLGLPISKALMEAFGGMLEIASAPGKGTVASAIFPASRVIR